MRGGDGTPRAIRRATIATRIELAALTLCIERGVENVTVEEIGVAAGISRRNFYRYFRTLDDILCAMPARSLQRISDAVSARPKSESIREAFFHASRNIRIPDEEREIQRLAVKVVERSPEAWWRAMSRVTQMAQEQFQRIIADRLRAWSQNPAPAAMIAAVLLTVIGQLCQEGGDTADFGPDPDRFDQALQSLALMDGVFQA